MSDSTSVQSEDKIVQLISDGVLKAKIDKQKTAIIFEQAGDSVHKMVKELESQTL